MNATDDGWPIKHYLRVRLEANDPQLIGPAGFWQAQDAPKLTLEAAFHTGEKTAAIFWTRADAAGFSEDKSVTFDSIPDGEFHHYDINRAASPEYRGVVTGLRLDPEPMGRGGNWVRLRSLALQKGCL